MGAKKAYTIAIIKPYDNTGAKKPTREKCVDAHVRRSSGFDKRKLSTKSLLTKDEAFLE